MRRNEVNGNEEDRRRSNRNKIEEEAKKNEIGMRLVKG